MRTAWEDIERFKEQKNKDLREALVSYAIMQISMCKKVKLSSVSPALLNVLLRLLTVLLPCSCRFCHRESRCGPTPRSVSAKCEPSPTPAPTFSLQEGSSHSGTRMRASVLGVRPDQLIFFNCSLMRAATGAGTLPSRYAGLKPLRFFFFF